MSSQQRQFALYRQQTGTVLAISLVFLLLLAMIGSFGMQNTILQERMTSNARDKDLAFQAAETTLKFIQRGINSGTISNFSSDGTGGLYSNAYVDSNNSLTDQNLAENDTFWTSTNAKVATDTTSNLGNNMPNSRYIVQEIPPINGAPAYKITVRSTGKNQNTVVVIQAIYTTE